jgi:hypothetical protein
MRCWRAPTGEFVVEGPPTETVVHGIIRSADDQPLAAAHVYYLFDTDGTVQEVYDTGSYGLDDYMYVWGHNVVDGVLRKYMTAYRTVFDDFAEDGDFRRTNTESAILDGLVEVTYEAAGLPAFAPALGAYRRRMAEAAEERQRPVVQMRASIRAVLSTCPHEGPVDLVFAYDDGPLLRYADGRVLWQPDEPWPYRGKDLHYFLKQELERHLGDRLRSYTIDVDTAPWWFWAPDE